MITLEFLLLKFYSLFHNSSFRDNNPFCLPTRLRFILYFLKNRAYLGKVAYDLVVTPFNYSGGGPIPGPHHYRASVLFVKGIDSILKQQLLDCNTVNWPKNWQCVMRGRAPTEADLESTPEPKRASLIAIVEIFCVGKVITSARIYQRDILVFTTSSRTEEAPADDEFVENEAAVEEAVEDAETFREFEEESNLSILLSASCPVTSDDLLMTDDDAAGRIQYSSSDQVAAPLPGRMVFRNPFFFMVKKNGKTLLPVASIVCFHNSLLAVTGPTLAPMLPKMPNSSQHVESLIKDIKHNCLSHKTLLDLPSVLVRCIYCSAK